MTVIELPMPPSTNNLFFNLPKGRGRAPTPEYKSWQTDAGWLLQSQRPKPMNGPVYITIECAEAGRRDLDSMLKAPIDLLVKHGVIEDDRCKFVRSICASWNPAIKGVRIRITSAQLMGRAE